MPDSCNLLLLVHLFLEAEGWRPVTTSRPLDLMGRHTVEVDMLTIPRKHRAPAYLAINLETGQLGCWNDLSAGEFLGLAIRQVHEAPIWPDSPPAFVADLHDPDSLVALRRWLSPPTHPPASQI